MARRGAMLPDLELEALRKTTDVADIADRIDRRLTRFMSAYGVLMLRLALGTVFVWFGALKVVNRSPVSNLISNTVYWLPAKVFVPFLGLWEIAVGLGLLLGVALRLTLFLFWVQMAGTFLVLARKPAVAFQSGNPLLLTQTGEFVIKNLVLVTAGIVIGGSIRRRRPTL